MSFSQHKVGRVFTKFRSDFNNGFTNLFSKNTYNLPQTQSLTEINGVRANQL